MNPAFRFRFLGLAVLFTGPLKVSGQLVLAPEGAGTNASVRQEAGNTTVQLSGPARLLWQQYRINAGESVRYVSENGRHASLNVVQAGLAASIHGAVQADGPFYLISPAGIQIGGTGSVQAPQILLSALGSPDDAGLLAGRAATFSRAGAGLVSIDGTVTALEGGTVLVLGGNLRTGPSARISAPNGRVQLVAADSSSVSASLPGGVTGAPGGGGSAVLNQEGEVAAREVQLFSDGFLRNAGRLLSTGPGNEVRLGAREVVHEARSDERSVISTGRLLVEGNFRQEGPVLNPDDGANPAPIPGLRQTPRLSSAGFTTTLSPGQTQLSRAPLQQAIPAVSPIPVRLRPAAQVTARSGTESVKKQSSKAPSKTGTVRKASFFGQTIQR